MNVRTPGLSLLTVLAGILLSCHNNGRVEPSIETRIVKAISHCNSKTPCTIRLRDFTNFSWDRMYAFKYTADATIVEKAVGATLKPFNELHRRLIFTQAGKVVFQEEEPTSIEHPVQEEVVFDIPESADYKVYGVDAVFKAEKLSYDNSLFYQLSQL